MLLVGLLSFLHSKLLLTKLFFESLQTYANQLLRLMPANYTRTRCVNPFPLASVRVEISNQRQVDSHLNKTRKVALKIWSSPIFNEQEQIAKSRASMQQADRRKRTASELILFVFIATLCSSSCPCQEVRPFLIEDDFQRGIKKRELDELRESYIREKGFTVFEMWECEWWRRHKTSKKVKKQIREKIPYRHSLAAGQLIEKTRNRRN